MVNWQSNSEPIGAETPGRLLTCTTTRNGVAHMPQAAAKSTASLVPGSTLSAPYPFVRDAVSLPDADEEGMGSVDVETWRPGTRVGPTYSPDGDVHDVADAMGQIELTVVSVHRPGKYPTRVFFTRQWVDPDGKRFGKKKLRMTTVNAFLALSKGYRHDFEIAKVGVQ